VTAWLARFIARLLFDKVEVAGAERHRRDRPVLLVANHFNGFVDPVLITAALRRTPRFVAKAALLRVPLVGFALRRVGVVFVRRREDSPDGAVDNEGAFVECDRALLADDVVAIFPEGTTHDRPQLDPVRTGAARIALGAQAAGATGLVILPVGLTFPDKVALRSSALVQFGDAIELDELCPGSPGAEDRDAVHTVTTRIDQVLRAVSPDFPDVETALALEQAAQVALSRRGQGAPSLAARYDLTRRLGRADAAEQAEVRRQIGRYLTLLTGLRLTDADVTTPTKPARLLRSAVGIAILVVILGGLVAATFLVNLWPALLVIVASLLVKTPVTKGTVRVIVGLVAFPAAWIVAAVAAADGAARVTLLAASFALGALAAIWLVERALALARMLLRWQAQRERIATVAWAEPVRAEVVATVRSVVGDEG
jgi:1-acyl-sn-glycerol-3-phosphate acyltransferase